MEKYYTPDLSEFRIGFEFEHYDCSGKMISAIPDTEEWVKYTCDWQWLDNIYTICKNGNPDLDSFSTEYRVKFLDCSDIENLGFKCVDNYVDPSNNTWYTFERSFHINPIRGHILTTIRFWLGRVNIDIVMEGQKDTLTRLFSGTIKNISELKQIMKMLNIE